MKRPNVVILLLSCVLLIPSLASAAPIRAYVAQFAVPSPDSGGLKSTLQTLLTSRLASDAVTPVGSASEAEVVITGSYTQFGKVFSLDAVAKLGSGSTVATVFEQGESQDDLIPALGRMSAKLRTELLKRYAAAPLPQPVKEEARQRGQAQGWISQRIDGAQLGLAPALTAPEGREFFVAEDHGLRLYRQEKKLKLLAEVKFLPREKVIAIDSDGPDQNGNPRVWVTIIQGETPLSKIFTYKNGELKEVASALPYLFRAISFYGEKSRIYAQQMGINEDFFGDLFEVSEKEGKVELKNPIKLPRYANVFNYNKMKGSDGTSYGTALSSDGYLVIYSEAGEEIWRSTEKFGGSETFFQREVEGVRDPNDKIRWRFIDQRITVTRDGEVIVPQNSGFFVVGNSRSYNKHAVVGLTWNGSSLEEVWRSKQAQNYLADYFLDPQSREIVLLEVVQKGGIFAKGGSAIRTISAE